MVHVQEKNFRQKILRKESSVAPCEGVNVLPGVLVVLSLQQALYPEVLPHVNQSVKEDEAGTE